MALMPSLDEKSGKTELLPSSSSNSPPPNFEGKRSKWNYLAFAVLGSLALVQTANQAGLSDTLLATIGSFRTEASRAELCPQEGALYPHKEYALFQTLTDSYGTEEFKARAIDWIAGAIQVETESYDAMGEVGEDPRWDKFADFHDYLAKAFPLTHATAKLTKVHTYGLVYHWQGSDSSLKPALLTAHQDVVPVHPDTVDEWVHPPYSGYYDGEYVWGRGSLDDKSGLVGLLSSAEVLLEHSFRPVRTIVFAFGFDEESGPVHSAGHLNDYLLATYGKDGFSILVDEGGGWGESYGSDMASVGIGEKGSISVKLQVASPGGHSSVPPPHTSIGILAALLVTYEDNPFPVQLARDTPIYETVQCLAMHSKSIDSTLRKFIKESTTSDKALKKASELLAENIKMKSLISTTQAIDIVNGGVKTNALPEQAYAIVNHRVATDSSIAATQKRDTDLLIPLAERFNLSFTAFGSLVSEADVPAYGNLALTGGGIDPAPVSPIDAEPFKVLSGSIRAAYNTHRGIEDGGPKDELVVSPGITTGNTDTRHYWGLTRHIFRYAHMYNGNATAGIRTGVHTTNEAVRAVDFVESIRYYTALIMNLNEAADL
ncbi:carboxypeptidase S [Stereum hirsutum FP-91666 SS1]|uniref:carboxypeptidase S n=1 Tax=Stereum hirsutum (strain FP-91666) TaxID=721885 RepID=UPI000440E718|nr:carboxypeptidase S [Stereum hirsutum FP-91666 SS1]EIM87284.1 carboxypeptidase S [Stereum hirsutum FP-91666 SS1]